MAVAKLLVFPKNHHQEQAEATTEQQLIAGVQQNAQVTQLSDEGPAPILISVE